MINYRERHNLTLELFPFISLFLCVIGVLSFLQNLLVVGQAGDAEKEAIQRQIFQTAFTFVCQHDRLVIMPPADRLEPLLEAVTVDEQFGLEQIRGARDIMRSQDGLTLKLTDDFNVDALARVLGSINTVNHLAELVGHSYEEYVLFDVRPGGSNLFHYVRQLLETAELQQVRYGLTSNLAPQPKREGGLAGASL